MDLTTRCPSCGTVFKAGLQDLQLRKGYIRCVQCAHIFDGYAEVVSESGASRAPRAAAPVPTPDSSPASRASAPPAAVIPPSPQVFRAGRTGREEPHVPVDISLGDRRPEPSIGQGIKDGRSHASERILISLPPAAAADKPEPFVVEPHPVRAGGGGSAAPLMHNEGGDSVLRPLGRALGGLLLALIILLALAQVVYIYRSQIALSFPALRPMIEQACVPLGCQVPYARDAASLSISGSALRSDAHAPEGTGDEADAAAPTRHYVLNMTLRNLADLPQEWPTIVLDLNDISGTRVVRRNLSPRDYLTPDQLAGPFAAHDEVLVRVPLAVSGVEVNGYQLDLFFP